MSSVVISSSRATESMDISYGPSTSTSAVLGSERGQSSATRTNSQYTPETSTVRSKDLHGFVMKRRLKGFVLDATTDTWRVLFVVNGEQIPYNLPAAKLREAGVESINQPFEMDELIPAMRGVSGKIYRFRPLVLYHAEGAG